MTGQNNMVSVIMAAYNCESYIRLAIESILSQTHSNVELLIADDGSKDDTRKIIDGYNDPRIKRFHNSQNMGYVQTCNKLAALATGDYLTFQDADDWSELKRFELLLNAFDVDPELACVGSFVNVVDEKGIFIKHFEYKTEHKDIVNDMLDRKIDCFNSSMLFKKEAYQKLGLYNLYFDRVGSEDYYWFGMMVCNYKVANIKEPLYNYRINPVSFSREKQPIPKKQMSGDLATLFFRYYYKTGKEIFQDPRQLAVIENYLLGKSYCWRSEFKKGVSMLLKSVSLKPFGFGERYSLLRIYLPKVLFKRG